MKKRIVICAAFCLAMLAGAAFLYFSPPDGAGLPCIVRLTTGFYCTGCGASRALRSILHLQFYQAFRFNPALVILLPFIALYITARLVDYVRTGKNNIDKKLPFKPLWWLLMLLLVYMVARNLPFYPFTEWVPTVVG